MAKWSFGVGLSADEVAQEQAERGVVRGAQREYDANEIATPEGAGNWGGRNAGVIGSNELRDAGGYSREYIATPSESRVTSVPRYDSASKYTFGSGQGRQKSPERSSFAETAGLTTRSVDARQPQGIASVPRLDLSKIESSDYYSGDESQQGDSLFDDSSVAPDQVSGGWSDLDELSSIPVSSYSVQAVSDVDMEGAKSSDKYDREHYTNRSQLIELQSNTRKRASDAINSGRHGYDVPDLTDKSVDENGEFVDPWREKKDVDYSELPSTNRLTANAIDSAQDQYLMTLSRDGVGGRVWEKLMPDSRLRFNEVGLGIADLEALLEQDPTHLNELLSDLYPDGASNHDLVSIVWSINYAARRRNGYEVRVGVSKPPDVRISDAQSMVLRIETDKPRGIFLNPMIAPLFNADFDGDDGHMSLDKEMAKMLRDTLDLLIDPDGTTHIDEKWFTTERIVDNVIDGISRRDFVRDIMFSGLEVNDAIVDAVLDLSDNVDSDRKNELLVNLITEIRKFVGSDNDRLGSILMSAYTTFQRLSRKIIADTLGTYVDFPVEPRSDDDRVILRFVDDVVTGKIPNNWYDFKRAFNSFIGDIRSGNSDFRVSASVGKRFKLDNHLIIGGEYVINLNDGRQVDTFLEATMEYASAMRQSHEEKQRGRSYSHTRQLKERIIATVGYSDSTITDENGNSIPRYRSTINWLTEFIKAYRIESALENEANLIVKTNLQISQASNRNVVASINPTGSNNRVTYGDIVDALVDVYGDSSMERVFKSIMWKEHQTLTDQQIKMNWKEREIWRPGNRGNWAVKEKYRSYSVRRFSKDNHVIESRRKQDGMNKCIIPVFDQSTELWLVEEYGRDKDGKYGISTKSIRNVSDNMIEMYLMRAIADQKTSSESAYATRVYGFVDQKKHEIRTTFGHDKRYQNAQQRRNEETNKYHDESGQHKTLIKMRFDLLQQMREAMTRDTHESRLEIRDILRTLNSSSPELFSYFGLDNEAGWNASEFSRAMLQSKNTDQLGGVNMTMHYAMRTNRILASIKALSAYMDAPGMAEMESQTKNEIAFMEQELASASQTWQAIMMEIHTGSGWSELSKLAKDMNDNPQKYKDSNTYMEAKWYWDDPRHSNVDEMMRDSMLGFVEKRDILCDLVRMHTGDSTFMSYEVCLQLEVGAGGEWSLQHNGQKQLFEAYNDFERSFNQYSDISRENMKRNIEDAYDKFGDSKGALMGAIHNLATHPGMMYEVSFDTMAEAVCSTMDRMYEQSEKNSTHPWANGSYQLLSKQRNGGYYNELFRTDDLVVGMQTLKQVTASDLVMLLDDPGFTLTGYNDIGQIVQVNRDQLLGFKPGESYDVEREVWRFLRDNPRLAGCLRMQSGAVSSGMDASGYTVATCDTTETIERAYGENGNTVQNPMSDMAYLMFDHPGFHAIASLCTPAAGSKASHRFPKIAATERYLCYIIYSNATRDLREAEKRAEKILSSIGITRSVLRENLMSDFDRLVSETDGIEERSEAIAEREAVVSGLKKDDKVLMYGMYDNCRSFMRNYLVEVAKSPTVDLKAGIKGVERPELSVDQTSIHSFYDVIQELSGAKTDVSTGIEGSETFQFGEWSSLIAAKDRYASLDAILDEIESDPELCQTFDGALTNGGVVSVENGHVSNIDQLRDAAGVDELVVLCPDTYEVKDKMIDSKGRVVSSQKSIMMSKRADGTEGHNLQVMKTGIDGLDSITKLESKYFYSEDKRGNRTRIDYDKRVQIIRDEAAKGSTEEEQMFLAKLCLAKELLKSNVKLKYNAWTLSNYMSIADLMLIRGDDNEIYLRSLEQLYTAIKHRIGVYGNSMSNDQRKRAAMSIVNDTSEYGCIGRATASHIGAFDELRPSRVSPSTHGIYPYLSDRAANRRMIDEIVGKLSDSVRGSESAWSTLRRETVERNIRKNHKWVNKVLKDAFILRQYHIVGCVDGTRNDEMHEVGMSSLFVIGEDIGKVMGTKGLYALMNRCWKHGETIMIPAAIVDGGYVHPGYAKEALPCITSLDGEPLWYMINTFHMRLNGAEAKPYKATYAQAQYPYEKDWFFAEDTFGEFDYGDSGGIVTQRGHDKISLSKQPETIEVNCNELFRQQFQTIGDHGSIDISFVDQRTLDDVLNHTIDLEMDIGVVEGAHGYDRRVRDIEAAIERYKQKTDNGDGMIIGQDCKAGDIVAWAMAKVREDNGIVRYVIAPIIPYELHGRKRGMAKFQCTDIVFKDGDRNRIAITMRNTSDIDGYAKMHLPSSGADKIMVDLSSPVRDGDRTLMDGTVLDSYVDYRTTMNRRIGSLSRLRTMETMIRMARMNGYNFANTPGSFPEANVSAPEGSKGYAAAAMKQALESYPPPSQSDWRKVINTIRFHSDPLIDAFVRHNCKKCLDDGGNPSHFLASQFVDPSIDPDNPINSMFQWEYLASFENSLTYEDAFLKFFHLVNPHGKFNGSFCPNGIDDNSTNCLFRLKQDSDGNLADGYDLGVLQMQVPHRFEDFDGSQKWVYVWECVFSGTGFFGEDFSMGSRPNIEGASRMSDTMNMIGSMDFDLSEADNRLRYGWSIADLGALPMTGSAVTL